MNKAGNREKTKRIFFIAAVLLMGTAAVFGALSSNGGPAPAITASAAALVLSAAAFSGRKNDPSFISLVAVLTALSVTGRIAFAPLAGFKPCTALIIIAGACLGSDAGFICGAITALVSNIYFGQGTWTLYQMFTWGAVGIAAGILGKRLLENRGLMLVFAFLSGGFYSVVMDVFSAIWQDGSFVPARFAALAAGSLPLTAVYAVSNVIFISVLQKRLCFAILRIRTRYSPDVDHDDHYSNKDN